MIFHKGSSGATHGVVSRSMLLERRRQRDRRHHGHRLPLLRLLADVNRLGGERFKRRAEAGERVGRLVVLVLPVHGWNATRRPPRMTSLNRGAPAGGAI